MSENLDLSGITLSDSDFEKFRDFFYRYTGIFFDDDKRYFVDRRIVQRIAETGKENFRSYFIMLRFQVSGEEMQTLVNLMTVNETYFFREEYQFQCMTRSLLGEILQRKTSSYPVRIWSIPSSSGEEPYSIALYLLEYWPGIQRYDVEIVASDIDTTMLEQARRGVYSKRSVQNLPKNILAKYFYPHPGSNEYQLIEDIRQSVEFTRINLSDAQQTRSYRHFDIIFCRNLLIYFDDTSRREAAEALFDALSPGGFICLGHSESMSRISSLFQVRKFPEAIVYQKPL